jgi:hypothetical protein
MEEDNIHFKCSSNSLVINPVIDKDLIINRLALIMISFVAVSFLSLSFSLMILAIPLTLGIYEIEKFRASRAADRFAISSFGKLIKEGVNEEHRSFVEVSKYFQIFPLAMNKFLKESNEYQKKLLNVIVNTASSINFRSNVWCGIKTFGASLDEQEKNFSAFTTLIDKNNFLDAKDYKAYLLKLCFIGSKYESLEFKTMLPHAYYLLESDRISPQDFHQTEIYSIINFSVHDEAFQKLLAEKGFIP